MRCGMGRGSPVYGDTLGLQRKSEPLISSPACPGAEEFINIDGNRSGFG
ncbi:hypothetical protein WN943_028116 [Citrus x changshan-huyou]